MHPRSGGRPDRASSFRISLVLNLLASSQTLTTRSISTRAPSGNSAAAIVVRAGEGQLRLYFVQVTDRIFHCPSILRTCQCSRPE